MPDTILLVGAPSYQQVAADLRCDQDSERLQPGCVSGEARIKDSFAVEPSFTPLAVNASTWDPGFVAAAPDPKWPAANHDQTQQGSQNHPDWRVLPLDQGHLTTGLTQQSWLCRPVEGLPSVKYHSFRSASSSYALESSDAELIDANNASFMAESDSIKDSRGRREEHHPGVGDKELEGSQHEESPCTEDEETQFLAHSLALHQKVLSQISIEGSAEVKSDHGTANSAIRPCDSPPSSLAVQSFRGAAGARISAPVQPPQPLNTIPTARFLLSKTPQTLTTTLLVGIIAIEQPRRITVRRTGRHVNLIEATVGDDTAAGFSVSFWVNSREDDTARDELWDELKGLRPGDLVLMQNIALAQFRGKVHGQSFGRSGGRMHSKKKSKWWRTNVVLMYRRGGLSRALVENNMDGNDDPVWDSDDLDEATREEDALTERGKKVRQWVLRFVCPKGLRGDRDAKDLSGKLGRIGAMRNTLTLPANDTPG